MIYYYTFHSREFSLFLHVNNAGHWLENYEVWAAPGHQNTVASQNGYVRKPWRRIASHHVYLDPQLADEETKTKIETWLLEKFDWSEMVLHDSLRRPS